MFILRLIGYPFAAMIFVGIVQLYSKPIPEATTYVATQKEVLKVFNGIKANLDSTARSINIKYSPSKNVNAHANRAGDIVIYQGMMDFVKSSDELALIIGHEIAHHTLAHIGVCC